MPEQYVKGPLGIWPWPILNVIIAFLRRLKELRGEGRPKLLGFLGGARTYTNLEEWELVEDEHGNLKKIVVHRKAVRK